MSIDGFEKLVIAAGEKGGYVLGALAAAALAFQRFRGMFRSEQKKALHTETEIEILALLREELVRLKTQNTKLEDIVHALQLENIELRKQLGHLQQVCEIGFGVANGSQARSGANQ